MVKKNFLVLGVLFILFLNFAVADCGDFICEADELNSCPSDCEIATDENYVPPEVVQDNSVAETIPNETSGELSNEVSGGEIPSDIPEESAPITEQIDLPVDESSFSLKNLFENRFVLIGGGVVIFIILFLIVFLILRKKKSSETPQQTDDVQPTQL